MSGANQSAVSTTLISIAELETPAIVTAPTQSLFGLDTAALSALFVELGEKAYRGKQLAEALYRQRIANLDEITTLPKALRDKLSDAGWEINRPQIAESFKSVDGTERYLIQTGAQTVETVWMPEGDDSAESSEDSGDV